MPVQEDALEGPSLWADEIGAPAEQPAARTRVPVQKPAATEVTSFDFEAAFPEDATLQRASACTQCQTAPLRRREIMAYALPAFSTTSLSLLISLYVNDFYGA